MPVQEQTESTLKDKGEMYALPEEAPQPVVVKKEPEKELLTWKSAARPFKRRNREFWVTAVAIGAVVGLVLFLVEGFMPVILVVSVIFLFYVLSTVEPDVIDYKITNKGIYIAGKRTDWELIGRFWFTRRFDSHILVTEIARLPGRMELVIDPKVKDEMKKILSEYLVEEEVPPSGLDRAANWFGRKLPQG